MCVSVCVCVCVSSTYLFVIGDDCVMRYTEADDVADGSSET